MKRLYMIGGTMGVGKTTFGQKLKRKLNNSVFLDGDWCWDMNPFIVNDETKRMVIDNICYMLNNFICCPCIENIIFCWVMHEQEIINDIISNLKSYNCEVIPISLVCSEKILLQHLENDIKNGTRTRDVIEKSISYLPLYKNLSTIKIDIEQKSFDEILELPYFSLEKEK